MSSIKEIAETLNLTPSTVSHALNRRPGKVSEATRRRVFEVARALNYAPNPAARALAAGRTGNIGFVSRHYNNALYIAVFQEIAIAVDERGGNLVTCVTGRETEHHGQDHLLHARIVDGILAVPGALPGLDAPDSPWMRGPVVFLLSGWEESRAPSVRFDDADGAAQVARHLWALGHRRLLFVQGLGVDGGVSGIGRERLGFLRDAWRNRGRAPEADIAERSGYANADGGRAALESALDTRLPFTAVIAYNDQMAVGATAALRARGVRVPEDVSVVGWNDLDDTLSHLSPSLTSVRTGPAALARAAVDLLYRRINRSGGDPDAPGIVRVRVPVQLIQRDSTRAR
jgi:DNA-binding LacI/PurR family transcriptional regulator